MKYKILDDDGNIVNIIIASLEFVNEVYPNHYLELAESTSEIIARRRLLILSNLTVIDTETSKPRTLREMSLNDPATKIWLKKKDDEAATLRAELLTL